MIQKQMCRTGVWDYLCREVKQISFVICSKKKQFYSHCLCDTEFYTGSVSPSQYIRLQEQKNKVIEYWGQKLYETAPASEKIRTTNRRPDCGWKDKRLAIKMWLK